MNNKVLKLLFTVAVATILSACSQEPPKCGDTKTLNIAKQIIAEGFANNQGSFELFSAEDVHKILKLTYARASGFNEKIRKFECEAELSIGENKKLSIVYNSQLDDYNQHIVSVEEFDFISFPLHLYISGEIDRIKAEAKKKSKNKPKINSPTRADANRNSSIELEQEAEISDTSTTDGEYINQRFNYKFSYPTDYFIPQGESENGDGQIFLSKDSKIKLLVYGAKQMDESNALSIDYEIELDSSLEGRQITYKDLKQNWYVISGIEDSTIFYMKTIKDRDNLLTFVLYYPKDAQDTGDSLLRNIKLSPLPN